MKPTRVEAAGHGLVAALALAILLGAGGLLAHGELETRFRTRAQARSIAALSQAREALLGYAISYDESHSGQGQGYLPCPDTDNTGSTALGACGPRGAAASGRLPWRTLALPQLLDGWGECLWYAVSGSVKHNPKALALNWDSPGQFRLWRGDGRSLPAAAPDGLAIAVVFAPGPVLDGQHRHSDGHAPCTAGEFGEFVETGSSLASIAVSDIHQGQVGSTTRNDLIAWLGIDDIYDALRRRSDFASRIDHIGETAALHLASPLSDADFVARHLHETPHGRLLTGRLPTAPELGIAAPAGTAHDNWRDQFHVALCKDGSDCITVIDPDLPRTETCRAVLLFGGERIRSGDGHQRRGTAAERADVAQYLEGDNPRHFVLGIAEFHGTAEFRITDPQRPASQDVVRCLS
ncbi:hypothetical protein [Thauera butanivorans]|uniref:hypothetical protein n=1 Tax=Thauera butanivorans TaxID=86174 RepID=UPI000838A82B|nr:hypothetical protein [Thauera butanivorans]